MNNFLDKKLTLPNGWKIYVTSFIGILIAVNTQLHCVSSSVQDAMVAVMVALGFWSVISVQNFHFEVFKARSTKRFAVKSDEMVEMEKAAIRAAFQQEVGILFSKLCDGYDDNDGGASGERFANGLSDARVAYQDAINRLDH